MLLVLLKHLPMPWPKTSETAMVSESSAKSRVCGSIHVGSCGYGSRVQDTSRPYNLVDTHDSHDEYLYTYRYISIHIDIHIDTYRYTYLYILYLTILCFSLFFTVSPYPFAVENMALCQFGSETPHLRTTRCSIGKVGGSGLHRHLAGWSLRRSETDPTDPWPISVS